MVAALQAPPRVRSDERPPARVVPLRLVPDYPEYEERLVVVHRQPRPRATRSKRAVYMRRRLIAASLGLGIVLTAAHAGVALGGPTTTPGRSPHPRIVSVVVQPGDTLWSIAERIAPSSNTARIVDKWAEKLGTSDVRAGQGLNLDVS